MRRCNIPQSLGKPGEDESTEAHSWDWNVPQFFLVGKALNISEGLVTQSIRVGPVGLVRKDGPGTWDLGPFLPVPMAVRYLELPRAEQQRLICDGVRCAGG